MKIIFKSVIFLLIVSSCSNDVYKDEIPPNPYNEYDYLITKNPKTGRPTPEKLLKIKGDIRSYFKKLGKKSASDLNWEERGPNNVGGRTRAIMFDPNDVTNKKVFAGGVSGGLWYNNDITNIESSWHNINDFWTSLGVTCISYDPNNTQVFYVGTGESSARSVRGGGLWKSADGGLTWNNIQLILENQEAVSEEAYYINDVVVRNDGGVSEIYISVAEKHFQGQWHSSKISGLWKSIDEAGNFIRIPLEANETVGTINVPYDIEIASDNSIWVGTVGSTWETGPKGGKVFKSTDGQVFTKVYDMESTAINEGQNRVEIAVAPSNANVAYILIADEDRSGNLTMKKTLDGGSTWLDMPLPDGSATGLPANDFTRGQSWYDLILEVKPDNENYLIAGGIDLFVSEDAAITPTEATDMTWLQVTQWFGGYSLPYSHADQHQIVFNPSNPNHVLFGSDGGVSTCYDLTEVYTNIEGGDSLSIEVLNKNYNVTQFYAGDIFKDVSNEFLIAGSQDNGSQYFNNEGMNSTIEVSDGDGSFCFFDDDEDIMITSYVYNNYRFLRKDGTFIKSFGKGEIGSFINPADYDSKNNLLISYGGEGKLIFYDLTENTISGNTKSITNNSDQIVTHVKIPLNRIDETKPDVFLGTSEGKVLFMHEIQGIFGFPIKDLTSPEFEGSVSSIDIGVDTSELIVTFSNYGVKSVWYTTDGGASWLDKESNLPDLPIRWGVFNKADRKNVLLATELGVWETKDITVEQPVWSPVNEGLANVRVNMLRTSDFDNSVVAATYGRGLFTAKLPGEVLSVDENTLTAEFKIYPNPVISEILYLESVSGRNIVNVELFNTSGQLVLNREFLNEGKTQINVSDFSGGQYVLKVDTDKGSFSKKIIIN